MNDTTQKLCINCQYYQAGKDEDNDLCVHPQSIKRNGGVREPKIEYTACVIRIAPGCTCANNQQFQPATLVKLVKEAGA